MFPELLITYIILKIHNKQIFMSGAKHSIASRLITPTNGINQFKRYEDARGIKLDVEQPPVNHYGP